MQEELEKQNKKKKQAQELRKHSWHTQQFLKIEYSFSNDH